MRSSFLIHNLHRAMQLALFITLLAVLATVMPASASSFNSCTTTTLTSSTNPSTVGQAVTFTANVQSAQCGGAAPQPKNPNTIPSPTGTVTFKDNGVVMGTGTLSSPATFTTSSLTKGSHNITAEYGGDVNYSGSQSAILLQQVSGPAEVPEADTLLLIGGGIGGLATWLCFQWAGRRRKKV